MQSLCINCGIRVKFLKRHLALQLDTIVISLLSEWISPRIISENDYVCEECRNLAMRTCNQNLSQAGRLSSSQQILGHSRVCILCGKSLLQRQSNVILRAHFTPIQKAIANIVSGLIQPHELSSTSLLCQPCWLKMKRLVFRQQQRQNIIEETIQVNTPRETVEQSSPTVTEQSTQIIKEEHSSPTVTNEFCGNSIILNNYKRAANTASHCVFPGCTSSSLHSISDSLRSQVLSDHKFYLPCNVRVCDNHLRRNLWKTLYNSENSYTTFNPEHIEHVFSFVNG